MLGAVVLPPLLLVLGHREFFRCGLQWRGKFLERLAREPKWRRDFCEDEAEVEVEVETPPLRGVIAPSLLCGCADCGISGKRVEGALPIHRPRAPAARGGLGQGGEWGRIISPSLLCACEDCGVSGKRSEVWSLPLHGARGLSTRRLSEREEECPRRHSMQWRFWRRRRSRELKSAEMGTLWVPHPGEGEPSGCGIQRAMEYVFSRDRVHDEEEKHRCILHFPSMKELFTHEDVEHSLVQLGWKPLTKRGGWRRYFKIEEPTLPYGLPTIAKLPGRSFVDAPKPIILDFVRTVNKRENRNIFCCWEHRGELLVSAGDRSILN